MGTFKNPDVWKKNLAYQIGDFALYNGTVYMAIKPVPAGTEMSADYWTDFSGGGGDSGGGGESTTDIYMWNASRDMSLLSIVPTKVEYLSGISVEAQQYSEIAFTELEETIEIQGNTITVHGIKITDAPVGGLLKLTMPSNYSAVLATGYAAQADAMSVMSSEITLGEVVPMPLEGMIIGGKFSIINIS